MTRLLAAALCCSIVSLAQEWPYYGGDQGGSKYSPLDQINRSNVSRLKVAWEWKTGEAPLPEFKTTPGSFEVTPIMIGGVLYLSTPYNRVVALDAEPACIERLRQRYPGRANLHAIACEAPSPCFSDLRRFQPDSCVCLNVLEHIADDAGALRAMASILPRGGRIVLLVPAFPSLYGPIDRDLGHYRRYRRGSLGRVAEAAGLAVRKLHYLNSAGFFAWWANSHIFRRHEQSARQIAFFDDVVVPVMSRVEDLVRPPFGQSLFAVLVKR